MVKAALLIGVSEYEPGLNPLPSAVKDVDAIHQVLVNPDIGGFPHANVSMLKNPDRQTMAEAIEQLFAGRRKNDLVLLFFSGHGKKDDTGRLYLATRNTRNTLEGDLIRASALPASFIHESMERSRSRRQVVILDSCFSGAFAEGLGAKGDGFIDIREQLGGEGRAVLTSSSSTQYSFEHKGSDLSIYTRFLIEGIRTGEADLDEDEVISIDELHEYASKRVREFQPAMKPEIYAIREGFKIRLTKVPPGNPRDKYRKIVKRYCRRGTISIVSHSILDAWRTKLALPVDEAEVLKEEVLKPYRIEFQQKIQRYEQAFVKVIRAKETIDDDTRQELQELQKTLELRNEDTVPIEAKVIAKIKAYQQNLQFYEEAFKEELRQDYPLGEARRNQMWLLAQQIELTDVDAMSIETRVTAEVEIYRHNIERYRQIFTAAVRQEYPISKTRCNELRFQQQNLGLTEVDIAQVEAQITTEIETYQQKLQQYEQALIDASERKYYLSESTQKKLLQTWQTLGLSEADVAEIEARVNTQIETYQTNLGQYETEFIEAIEQQYPLSQAKQLELLKRQQVLTISKQDVAIIETRLKTELEEHLKKLRQYEQALVSAMEYEQPLTDETREDLQQLQKVLELDNEDTASIEEKFSKVKEQEQEEYQNKLQQYEQEFLKAVEKEYPLSKHTRNEINICRQSLELKAIDVERIEQPILAIKYQEKQQEQETQDQQEEAERFKQVELPNRQKRKEYENKLYLYKKEFSRLINRTYPIDKDLRHGLKNFQQSLGLGIEDVKEIESFIVAVKEHQLLEAKKQPPKNFHSQSRSRQAKFLLSKIARRNLLLGSTVLGLVLILSAFPNNNGVLFILGNAIILCVNTKLAYTEIQQDIVSWKKNIIVYGSTIAIVIIISALTLTSDCDVKAVTTLISLCQLSEQKPYIFGLITYLISTYIGLW